MNLKRDWHGCLLLVVVLNAGVLWTPSVATPSERYDPFEGDETKWHGFDRYDFLVDEHTLEITPHKASPNEGNGIQGQIQGKRRCIVVVPERPATGNPWSWRGCYWDHQPQTEVELLKRGFHVAYVMASAELRPDKIWDAWYTFLTDEHGLSSKPAFVGMSRGGEFSYKWATANPSRVSCIYADNPGCNQEALMKLVKLADNDVPLLHVCGSLDPLLGRNSSTIETIYRTLGGRISVMIKEGAGHHPHSLRNPEPIVDFIVRSITAESSEPPAFAGDNPNRTYYYSSENQYRDFPSERLHITCRGPLFSTCYNRYFVRVSGVEGSVIIIAPPIPARGNPWVFRADFVEENAPVDSALLARGFYIVTGPVPYNADGPILNHWNMVYSYLTGTGLSKKPVMGGAGAAVGEAYAWAIENPDKVSCIYGENPVLRSNLAKAQPLDNLAPLAKAGVEVLHVCGGLDPYLSDNTRVVEKRYREIGGRITVIVNEGVGHHPTGPNNPKPVLDFIMRNVH